MSTAPLLEIRMRCRGVLWLLAFFCAVPSLATAQSLGQPVVLAWDLNPDFRVGYFLYVGTAPSIYREKIDAGSATSFVYRHGVAGLRYYFAVAAYSAAGVEGARSPEVSTVVAAVGSSPGGDPGMPTGATSPIPGLFLRDAVVTGSRVTLTWSPMGALQVVEYMLEAGSQSGLSDLYNGSVGGQTSLSAMVGKGTYFVRVRARTSVDSSVLSNEVRLSIGPEACLSPPSTPTGVRGAIDGGVATLTWTAASGAASYVVQAGTASGLSNVFHGNIGDRPFVSAMVGPGFSAHIRVIAVNACGQSAASDEIILP